MPLKSYRIACSKSVETIAVSSSSLVLNMPVPLQGVESSDKDLLCDSRHRREGVLIGNHSYVELLPARLSRAFNSPSWMTTHGSGHADTDAVAPTPYTTCSRMAAH